MNPRWRQQFRAFLMGPRWVRFAVSLGIFSGVLLGWAASGARHSIPFLLLLSGCAALHGVLAGLTRTRIRQLRKSNSAFCVRRLPHCPVRP
jgi:hypothetical protein